MGGDASWIKLHKKIFTVLGFSCWMKSETRVNYSDFPLCWLNVTLVPQSCSIKTCFSVSHLFWYNIFLKKSSTNSNRKLFQHSYLDQLDKISLYFDLHVWTIVFGRPWSDICIEATDTLLTGMYPVTDPQRTRLLYLVQPIWFHGSIHLFWRNWNVTFC